MLFFSYVFILKSIPIVVIKPSENVLSVILKSKDVFPIPESPTKIIFYTLFVDKHCQNELKFPKL